MLVGFGCVEVCVGVLRPCMVQQMLHIRKSSLGKTHLGVLKHQNTKTSLYKLSKNHCVITLFEIFGSVRRDLQSTVSLDHPVLQTLQVVLERNKSCLYSLTLLGGELSHLDMNAVSGRKTLKNT